jgi:hypothetical protein
VEEYFVKDDDRKPWQKNMGIAVMVFIVLYMSDALETLADGTLMAAGNIVKNIKNKKKFSGRQPLSHKKQANQDIPNHFQNI